MTEHKEPTKSFDQLNDCKSMQEWARLNPAIYSTPMPAGVRNAFGENIKIPTKESIITLNRKNKQSGGEI